MRTLFNHTPVSGTSGSTQKPEHSEQSRFVPRSQGHPSSQNLDFHANIVHTRRSPFLQDKHKCDFSLRGYSSKHGLVENTRTVHRHNTLICELCLKAFKSRKTSDASSTMRDLSLFVLCKACHQYNEHLKALAWLNSPQVFKKRYSKSACS